MKKYTLSIIASLLLISPSYSQNKSDPFVFTTNNKIIYDICLTAKGRVIGIADGNNIKTYSTDSHQLIYEFWNGHKKQILTIDIARDSTLMVSGGKDSTIVIWDFLNGEKLKSLTYHKGVVTSVKISPNRKYIASGGTDNKVILYDIDKDEVIRVFTDHKDDVTSVEFNNDGSLLATASGDKTINIYDLTNLELVTSLSGHKNWVRDISFSGDATRLISCGDDHRIIIWNMVNDQNVRIISNAKIDNNWILSVDFSDNDKIYAYGGVSGKAKIITPIGFGYMVNVNAPVNTVLLMPGENVIVTIAVATKGKGVMLIDTKNMLSQSK